MKRYKVVSFDMFQTLVDVNTQKDAVLRNLFADRYTRELGDSLWEDANSYVFDYFHRMADGVEGFSPVVGVFEACYRKLFPKYGISILPAEGARILARAHGKACFFKESLAALKDIGSRYKTCLISDADGIMVGELLEKLSFDRVYISEEHKTYKFDKSGALFRKAIGDFGILPCELLHVGDGYSDVAGAKLAGADAAWLNRTGRAWNLAVRPDYVLADLSELCL